MVHSPRTMHFPFITQADFYGSRGLRELSVSTTGATSTLGVGTNFPQDVAIDPSGAYALVAVRTWPPAPRAVTFPRTAPRPALHTRPRPAQPHSKV